MAYAKSTQTKAGKNKKIKEKFYPLQHDEWVKACKELSPAAKDVLYYIRTVDPFSNGVELTAAAIARELEVHRSTISRAFKELDAKGYIDMEILMAKVRVVGRGLLDIADLQEHFNSESSEIGDIEELTEPTDLSQLEVVAKMQQGCENATTSARMQQPLQKCTDLRENAQTSAKMQQAEAETLTPRGFPLPKTNKDFNKNNQTLSEATRERNLALWENLDMETRREISYFAYQVAIPKLPIRPTLPEAWIIRHCGELGSQMMYDVEFQRKLEKRSANSSAKKIPTETEEIISW